jgi:4-hydroxy-tetrahydrodipicolinate synthase
MMASGDEHLLSCFVLGSAGSIVSLAAIMPAEIVALERAVLDGDMAAAGALHARIQPLANVIYGLAPGGHATARLKACMALLGRWPDGATRPPITGITAAETDALRAALIGAGLLEATA